MTGDELRQELEKTISSLSSSGFASIDTGIVEKLDKYAVAATELGMKQGTRLIQNLSGAMKAIQEGKSKAESGSVRLTALEFYMKNLSDGGSIEEL